MRCPPPTEKPHQRHHPWAKLTVSALAGPQQVANSEVSRVRAAPSGTQRHLLLPTRTGRGESRTPSPVGHAAARPLPSTVHSGSGIWSTRWLPATPRDTNPHTRCHALCRTKATALPAAPTARKNKNSGCTGDLRRRQTRADFSSVEGSRREPRRHTYAKQESLRTALPPHYSAVAPN